MSDGAEHSEIVVMGAGIVGLFNAIQLAKRGFSVTLIDDLRRRPSLKVGESLFGFSSILLIYGADLADYMSHEYPKDGFTVFGATEGRQRFEDVTELGHCDCLQVLSPVGRPPDAGSSKLA